MTENPETSSKEPSPDDIKALAKLSSCEISDALIKLQVPHGGYIPDIEMQSPSTAKRENTKIVGPAYTVKMVGGSDKDAPKLDHHFADNAPKDSVMVISAPSCACSISQRETGRPRLRSHVKNACWGGLMTVRAQALGVKGVVIDGRCRDLKESWDAGFPIFARGHSTLGQGKFVRPSTVQETLTIHARATGDDPVFPSVEVANGSYVVADMDGVVIVPLEQIKDVVQMAAQLTEADAKVLADLKKGSKIADAFKKHRG